jgi:hypothetical protein
VAAPLATENNGGFDENMNGGRERRGATTGLSILAVAWDTVPDLVVIAMDVHGAEYV